MEKQEFKLLSFIMPVYGDQDSVEAAVDSIMDQDYPAIEMILSVDGCKKSEKVVKKIVEKYKNHKFRIEAIYAKENQGACIARNEGAKIAKGDYFSFLPADAVLFPGVARTWMNILMENPDYDFLYGGYKFVDQIEDEKTLKKWAKDADLDFEEFLQRTQYQRLKDDRYLVQRGFDYISEVFDPYFLDTTNYIDGSFPLKRETFEKIGGWDANIKSLQDWDFWLSVVKGGGKGIFVRDIFFETSFPHKGGLSWDSTNNWLERTKTIKKKHKIPERKVCVASLGAPFHGRRMARVLDADYKQMPSFKPHEYEMVYLLGFFPSMADTHGAVFERCRGKRVIHWIGSDIWQMQQMDLYHRKMLLDFFEKNIDYHLCEAKFTQDELKELGIDAKIVPLPPKDWYKPSPLPKKFTVAVYQPQNNKEFYLPELCKEIAEKCPEFEFKFFGDNSQVGRINNIHYTGYVENMQSFISDCSALLRLTIHDGLPITALEFIGAGRHTLLNVPMKHSHYTKTASVDVIAATLKEIAKKPLNEEGMKYWRRKASHKKYKDTIYELLEYNPKEYWEDRAESWSQLADQDYSLPIEDKKEIEKWIKRLDFKSVLDIGCGNARFKPMFEGKRYKGVDISEKLIKICRERYPEDEFQTVKVEDLDEPEKYDLVFSYTCLEHIKDEDFAKAVEALKAVGKKLLLIEPEDFTSVAHCHDHNYSAWFDVVKKKKLSDKTMYLCDL